MEDVSACKLPVVVNRAAIVLGMHVVLHLARRVSTHPVDGVQLCCHLLSAHVTWISLLWYESVISDLLLVSWLLRLLALVESAFVSV